jgi:transcriptional regulator with XRE-family HTH domain
MQQPEAPLIVPSTLEVGERGLTQDQLAETAGVKRGAIARWESGAREPSWSNLVALADALGVSTEAFRQEAAPAPAPQRGRPRTAAPQQQTPKRPRGRPRKGG